MNIFEAIRADHEKQRTLLSILTKTHGDSRGREEIYARLKRELETHESAEERFFYAPLIQDDLTQEKARHSVAEHHEIDEMIEKLDATELSSPAWLVHAKKLQELVEHHLEEEEQEVFQMAGKALSDARKESLANQYQAEMDRLREEHESV
ncbi:MAG: hemerythrin domain-containing protein [Candidatus Eisenbacteria bacterium]